MGRRAASVRRTLGVSAQTQSPPGHEKDKTAKCGLFCAQMRGREPPSERSDRAKGFDGGSEANGDGQCGALGQRPERSESVPPGHQFKSQVAVDKLLENELE
jgi:hypothetical protein